MHLPSKGFPDRVYFNRRTKELVLVEVKEGRHSFHQFQKQMLHMLTNGRKRKALLVRYELTSGGEPTKTSETDALRAEAKGWEGIEDYGLISGVVPK